MLSETVFGFEGALAEHTVQQRSGVALGFHPSGGTSVFTFENNSGENWEGSRTKIINVVADNKPQRKNVKCFGATEEEKM